MAGKNITRIKIYAFLSAMAFGLMYLFTALMILIGFPFIILKQKRIVKFLMRFWARFIFLIIGKKLHVEGLENIRNDLHFILLANHSSLFDIIAIVSVIPDLSWFGHERLLKIPIFRRVLLLTDYIPMRKTSVRNTKEMIDQLILKSKDHNIAIFPEGTRTLSGKINDFYRGFIILIRASEINALPVTLNGFYSLKPKNRNWIDFSARLSVIIHEPIKREFLINKTDREIADIIKATIEAAAIDESVKAGADYINGNTNFSKA
jgi:1-acyl-sn-glycerol-3-phosphate acyltransferase